MAKKVFVSGCYDMLHSGHVAFFTEASSYGDLYVGIGSDKTIEGLKDRKTINPEQERLYMVKALKVVKEAWINSGNGLLDFVDDLKKLKPDIFFVNSDGHTAEKEELCEKLGIEYVVSQRIPEEGLPVRSTTTLREVCTIPYRLDLAGGWLDQPYVSKYGKGAVITICVEPEYEFNTRSGMSTSSRNKAIELWQTAIPKGNKEKLAKTLFCYENPPGTSYVTGSQDSLGIVMPALNRYIYDNSHWPEKIESVYDEDTLNWIENNLWLVPLSPRVAEYDVLANTNITQKGTEKLSLASEKCWNALIDKDLEEVGKSMTESFEAQIEMFPNMVTDKILEQLERYKKEALGWKLSGAGGGGYLVFWSENPITNAIQIKIRRK